MSPDPWRHVNREHFPLVYVGLTNRHIEEGTPVKLIREKPGRMGMRAYTAADGEAYLLLPSQVVPYVKPAGKARRAARAVKSKVKR